MDDLLRNSLIAFIRRKFYSCANVAVLADDIVHEAYVALKKSPGYSPEKENFGYLSAACLRIAYRQFMSQSRIQEKLTLDIPGTVIIDETDFVEEIMQAQDTKLILDSFGTLKAIERIIVTQRYYGNFSFAEIADANNLNINTVLSHHRRALEKLKPKLTRLLCL
ncbi:MAG: RNA polymerase sigma factor [Clostridiales bacterium]|jgi:RNA polymerase sigma-70 factor (ECF subfamily)|nr:RNA polymerase sigma factor [Clostridiales bacterium]